MLRNRNCESKRPEKAMRDDGASQSAYLPPGDGGSGGSEPSEPTLKGGNLILRGISVPEEAPPNSNITATVEVSNGALLIDPWEEDKCGADDNPCSSGSGGYCIEVHVVSPDGRDHKIATDCIGTTEVGTVDKTYTKQFSIPNEQGWMNFEAYIKLSSSEKSSGRVSDAVVSIADSTTDPPDDDGGGDGDNGDDGGNRNGGSNGDDTNGDNNNDDDDDSSDKNAAVRLIEKVEENPLLAGGFFVGAALAAGRIRNSGGRRRPPSRGRRGRY